MANLKRYQIYLNGLGQLVQRESKVGDFVKFGDIKELLNTSTNTGSLPLLRCDLSAPCSKRRISGLCGYRGECYWKAQQQQAGA